MAGPLLVMITGASIAVESRRRRFCAKAGVAIASAVNDEAASNAARAAAEPLEFHGPLHRKQEGATISPPDSATLSWKIKAESCFLMFW